MEGQLLAQFFALIEMKRNEIINTPIINDFIQVRSGTDGRRKRRKRRKMERRTMLVYISLLSTFVFFQCGEIIDTPSSMTSSK